MRAPLIVLIIAYAISVLGMVLIPGVDENGEPWRMSFFHAFYFVSYMATTIGFGEIPHEFTDGQRFWTLLTLYLTVISWLYAIGKILALAQDSALKRALRENSFGRHVKHIREPFYIICGYGDTGSLITKALTERGIRVTVVDINQSCVDELLLEDLRRYVPGISGDVRDPSTLLLAGLKSRYCMGILALTDDDSANLRVAIISKLLNTKLKVICRAESQDTQANMASFGTDYILNPFEAFAEQLATALHSPSMHSIFEWLTQLPRTTLVEYQEPPRGRWIICGYGRFGKAVEKFLKRENIDVTIIEADPEKTGCAGRAIKGRGTEAETLQLADINSAVGIVSGTNDDANNLSILMTAKDVNKSIYTVARQNRRRNGIIFEAADVNQVMQHSVILTLKILALLTAPLLSDFLRMAQSKDNAWAKLLSERLLKVADGIVPDIWAIRINGNKAPAISDALDRGMEVKLSNIIADPGNRHGELQCLPLLLKRGDDYVLLPEPDENIERRDQILFCGNYGSSQRMLWTLQNHNTLRYIMSGETRPDGYIWRWLAKRQSQRRVVD